MHRFSQIFSGAKRMDKFIVAFLVFQLSTFNFQSAFGQAASPYSRYGLGYVRSTVFSANKGMGEVAAGYASGVNINFTNPASYASLTRTTVEIGANLDGVNIATNDSLYKSTQGSISHFALGFAPPVKRNSLGISIGLLPFTSINYNFVQNFSDSSIGNFRQIYSGKGSLYQIYAGAAYKVKGFSIGANLGFVFGKLDYQKTINFPDTAAAYSTRNVTYLNVKSFVYSVGVQYNRRIFHDSNNPDARNDIFVTVGAYGSGGMKMNARLSNYWERFYYDATYGLIPVDTPSSSFEQKTKINLPFNIGTGLMFGNERFWMAGVDFKFMNWQNYSSPLNNAGLGNSWKISAGFQVTPKYDDNRKFFNRVQYRFGGYYGKSEVMYHGKNLSEAGGTLGLGIPFKNVARLNLTADIGTRGGNGKEAIRENYYKITFGFVLNDIWFVKRKLD